VKSAAVQWSPPPPRPRRALTGRRRIRIRIRTSVVVHDQVAVNLDSMDNDDALVRRVGGRLDVE
jgi:hypothetical protein